MAELIIPPALRERHRIGLRRAVETGVDTMVGRRVEIPALRRSGEEFPVELALSRISTEAGPVFTAHIQDISERKRAEAERERALAKEKELSELKSRFVSMVSHEFRTRWASSRVRRRFSMPISIGFRLPNGSPIFATLRTPRVTCRA
jgi:signal transduction histidine kinase